MDARAHAHTQSATSEQFHDSCGPTVCRCVWFPCIVHLQSPPECVSPSVCLSVCLCTALSKSLYKHKGAREASTCNFSAINRPMKHSSESSYYSFPIPPSWKSKIALSFPPSDPVNPSIALQHKHLSALDAVALNAACNVRHHQTGACLSCLLKENNVLHFRHEQNLNLKPNL